MPKKRIPTLLFSIFIFIGLIGLTWSHFNIFYYLLTFSKIMTLFTLCVLILYIVFGSETEIEMWRDFLQRDQILREKMIQAFSKSYLVYGLCIIILLTLPLTGLTDYWQEKFINPGPSLVSSFRPNIIEGIIIILNFILNLLTSWNGMYFFVGRYFEILKYDFKKEFIKINLSGFLKVALIYALIFWIFFGSLDLTFINILENKPFNGTEFMKIIFEPIVQWIPVIELPILISINLIFYLYGKRNFKNRIDLVVSKNLN